jgi:hypothetical protein
VMTWLSVTTSTLFTCEYIKNIFAAFK